MPLRHGSDCSQSGPHPLRVWSFWPQKATNHPFAPEVDDSWPIASCILRGREMQPIETHMDDRFSKSYSQFQFQREQAWTWSPVSRDWNHLVCWRTWSYMATKLSRAGIWLRASECCSKELPIQWKRFTHIHKNGFTCNILWHCVQ